MTGTVSWTGPVTADMWQTVSSLADALVDQVRAVDVELDAYVSGRPRRRHGRNAEAEGRLSIGNLDA